MNDKNQSNRIKIALVVIGFILISGLLLFGYKIVKIGIGFLTIEFQPPSQRVENPTQLPMSQLPTEQSQLAVSTNPPQPQIDLNPNLNLPFQDNFDQGLAPEWRILSGDPVVLDGKLKAVNELTIQIGNNSLGNYSLEFDCCGGTGKITVTIGQKLRFWFMDCGLGYCGYGGWEGYSNGEWNELARFDSGDTPGRFIIGVNGNSVELNTKLGRLSEITYGDTLSGPLTISLQGEPQSPMIDNLIIK